jgi:hypothetical protein
MKIIFAIFCTTVQLRAVNFTNYLKEQHMKLKKKFEILMIIFAVIVGFYSLFMTPFLTPFVLGGVILQGILGGFSGKVGPVVGGKWKDIDYMRSYVIPSNPNTAGQQAVRLKFSNLVATARDLLPSILQPFWDPFYSGMSGFNAFISQNYANASVTGIIDETAIMSLGTLEVLPDVAGVYTTGSGNIALTWEPGVTGNGLNSDQTQAVAIDLTTGLLLGTANTDVRSGGSDILNVATGLTATNIAIFMFAFRGTGGSFMVSDSNSAICTAP